MLSWRGRSLNLTNVTHNRLKLRKGGVKTEFLQGPDTGHDVELVAELVTELGEPLHISENQVVVNEVLLWTDRRFETVVADSAA